MKEIREFCKPLHLLYVEDNDQARFFTLEFLSRFFDHISVAKDGLEGIERFHEAMPDLIISDINMPKMGGVEMVRTIRPFAPLIPVIFLSAHNEEAIRDEALSSGGEHYLIKPLDFTQFFGIIKKLIHFHAKSINMSVDAK